MMNIAKSVLYMVLFLVVSPICGCIAWVAFLLFSPCLIHRIAREGDTFMLDDEDRKQRA